MVGVVVTIWMFAHANVMNLKAWLCTVLHAARQLHAGPTFIMDGWNITSVIATLANFIVTNSATFAPHDRTFGSFLFSCKNLNLGVFYDLTS